MSASRTAGSWTTAACLLSLCLLATWGVAKGSAGGEDSKKSGFPLTTQFSSVELDMSLNDGSCPTPYQRSTARELISQDIQSLLPGLPQQLITCDKYHIGKVPHCAVDNCSVLFEQATTESSLIHFSGFYWLKLQDQPPERVYCNRETGYPEVPSCDLLFSYHPTAQSGYHTLLLRDGVRLVVYCDRDSGLPQPESCGQAYQLGLPSGLYTLHPPPNKTQIINYTVFCDMDHEECGRDAKWWTHIASLNMSDSNASCPSNWSLVSDPIRGCSRTSPAASRCDSVIFAALGHNYTKVCGRVVGYQSGRGFGFWPITGRNQDLDGEYISGVSITHGGAPRTHVWSFAASLGIFYCPCAPEYETSSESLMGGDNFVGNNYFCEMGSQGEEPDDGIYDTDNPLWDGATCSARDSCCSVNNPPWFTRNLPSPTTDDIEVRICGTNRVSVGSTPISLLDIYIH